MVDNPDLSDVPGDVAGSDEKATRERILAAAGAEFVEYGLDGARMQRIAERSGANKAMIYYYFGNKQALYEQVIGRIIRQNIGQLVGILAMQGGQVEEKVRSLGKFYCDLYGDRRVMPVILRELASGAPTLRKVMRELMEEQDFPVQRFWPELIEEGKRSGRIRDIDPMHALASLMGMAAGYYFLRPVADTILSRTEKDAELFARQRPEQIIDVFLNGILQK